LGTGTSGRKETSAVVKAEARGKANDRKSGERRRIVLTARNGPSFLEGTMTKGDFFSPSLALVIFLQSPQGWFPSKVLENASVTELLAE